MPAYPVTDLLTDEAFTVRLLAAIARVMVALGGAAEEAPTDAVVRLKLKWVRETHVLDTDGGTRTLAERARRVAIGSSPILAAAAAGTAPEDIPDADYDTAIADALKLIVAAGA